VFLEEMKKVSLYDNRPPSKQVKHVVMDEVMNENQLVKVNNCISLKEKLLEDMENESTSNFSSESFFVPPQDEDLNEPQQDG